MVYLTIPLNKLLGAYPQKGGGGGELTQWQCYAMYLFPHNGMTKCSLMLTYQTHFYF